MSSHHAPGQLVTRFSSHDLEHVFNGHFGIAAPYMELTTGPTDPSLPIGTHQIAAFYEELRTGHAAAFGELGIRGVIGSEPHPGLKDRGGWGVVAGHMAMQDPNIQTVEDFFHNPDNMAAGRQLGQHLQAIVTRAVTETLLA
jgi:hypothetical protein